MSAATPNPSLERNRNDKAPWPLDALVYDATRGQGALPPRAARLKRSASWAPASTARPGSS